MLKKIYSGNLCETTKIFNDKFLSQSFPFPHSEKY